MHRRSATVLALVLVVASLGVSFGAGPVDVADAEETPAPVDRPQHDPPDGDCDFPVERTDATGANVSVQSDPDEVVALQPSAAQVMWEIGASDEVVGMPVNEYTSDLEGYDRSGVEDVVAADGVTIDVETVVDLEPALVLSPNVTDPDTVSQLREAEQTVYHFPEAETIDDVYEETRLVGRLTGNCDGADERVSWMQDRIGAVREAVEDEGQPSVIYPLGGGVVAGSETFLHEIITTAGGENLAAEAGVSGYEVLSAEEIVDRDPEWLILNDGLPREDVPIDDYDGTTALEHDQVVRVNPNEANQPGPRVVYPIETIARALHPEATSALNGSSTPTHAEPTTATVAETNTPGTPGFGFVAGVLAIAVTLLALGRSH